MKAALRASASGERHIIGARIDAEWKPNRVARKLPAHDFGAVWVVGLCTAEDGAYIYGVANLYAEGGDAPTWVIQIAKDFGSWVARRVQ